MSEHLQEKSFQPWENPAGTEGFEFLEYASPKPEILAQQFESMGFVAAAKHKSRAITVYQQGSIRFILNAEPGSAAVAFSEKHGACASAMGFRVKDAAKAHAYAVGQGATSFDQAEGRLFDVPAIYGIGGSVIYLIDHYDETALPYGGDDFIRLIEGPAPRGLGLTLLDHVTHNVFIGNMDKVAGEYEKRFNFKEIRFFDISGKYTGLKSRAMTSPCGNIRIPINESRDDKSQIAEYLEAYDGEGIQHIALAAENIYDAVEALREKGIDFLTIPDTYYELLDKRVPGHNEDMTRLQKNRILVDGAPQKGDGLLLQIFTANMLGPIFFEIIQRKGNEGFGEGNFQALFESMELDQIRRGVLQGAEEEGPA